MGSNHEDIARVVATNARYYNKDLDEITLAFYIQDLSRFPATVVSRAFAAHRNNPSTGAFMPRVADIVREIVAMSGDDDAAIADEAFKAWEQVVGSFRTSAIPSFSDHIRVALSSIGGIDRVRMAQLGRELEFTRRAFVDAYVDVRRRGISEYFHHPTGFNEIAGTPRKQRQALALERANESEE